jgi:hypothetical protein
MAGTAPGYAGLGGGRAALMTSIIPLEILCAAPYNEVIRAHGCAFALS